MNQVHVESWLTRLDIAAKVTGREPLRLAAELLVTRDEEVAALRSSLASVAHQLDASTKVTP